MLRCNAAGGGQGLAWAMTRCLRALAATATLLVGGAVSAATWQPVPGATELEVDLASLQQERTRVVAWLRWWGRSALLPAPVAAGSPRVHRSTVRTEFDCARRTLRPLAANAYDSDGTAVFMASGPGTVVPVPDGDLGWAYDALCEAARVHGRF